MEVIQRFFDGAAEDDCRIFPRIIKKRFGFFEEEGKIIFNTRGGNPVFNIFIDCHLGRISGKFLSPMGEE